MKLIYANQDLEVQRPSIFLAGPTPRESSVPSWRPQAIQFLNDFGFTGTVLVPERQDWSVRFDYLDQVEWEFAGLERASVLLFWVPRDLENLPGFTTNVEFGRYVNSGRMVYGRPDDRPHVRYLDWLYQKFTGLQALNTLEHVAIESIRLSMVRTDAGPDGS